MMRSLQIALLLLVGSCCSAQQPTVLVDDFSGTGPLKWSSSMSPDYYKGDTGSKGLEIVTHPERGQVLAADVRFVDATKSEPCFITRDLEQPVPLVRLRNVSFWYKLVGDAGLDPRDGFKVRLRTSPTEFNDYTVAAPVTGRWVQCVIDANQSNVVNVWGKIFRIVKQITFRLDDVDSVNSHFTLLVADIQMTLDQPLEESYTPKAYRLTEHPGLNVLQIRHAAAGHYMIAEAAARVADKPRLRTYPFKGLHFGLDLYGYPPAIEPLLDTDLIVLVDVDPFIFTPQQARDLADLVYSGTGLIFFGGAETLAKSRDFRRPLAELLPVTFTAEAPEFSTGKITLGPPHFVNTYLNEAGLGSASSMQRLTAKPGATVALQGGDRPLVVLGEFGKGRVAVVNAMPNLDREDDLFSRGSYFTLLSRLMQWTTRRDGQALAGLGLTPRATNPDPPRVPPLDRTGFFPIITMAGLGGSGHYLDEGDIRQDIERMRGFGFNTIAVGGLNALQLRDNVKAGQRNSLTIQRLAQEMGLATIFEYTSFNLINSQGATKPCVFSPEYAQALAQKLQPQIEVAKCFPRLLSVKILDEPSASASNLDYCAYCQREFQKRYGIALRKFEEIPADAIYERWAFSNFIGDYVAEGYRQGHELKEQSGAKFDLLLTYMANGLGYEKPLSAQQCSLKWTKQADRFDFDVYPYFYPASQKLRMVQVAWCMAYARQVSQHLRKPWGFYVELDDRNWPFQKNPKEASAECAYEAVLHGANYLNSFIHVTFGTGSDARPERWEWTGQELRKISALGPKLTRLQRPRAPVAFLYPTSQTYITDLAVPKPYSYACVSSGFGNVDVLPEDVALEQGDIQYKTLILLGCDILHADMAAKLRKWLAAGGTLIADTLPTRNHKGEALGAWLQGKVTRLDFDLELAYKAAIERDNAAEAKRLRRLIAGLIGPFEANAVVTDAAAQMEVGVRTSPDSALVIVVNHDAKENTGQVTVRDLGFAPKVAREAATGKAYPVQIKAGVCTFAVKLPARQAVMVELRAR